MTDHQSQSTEAVKVANKLTRQPGDLAPDFFFPRSNDSDTDVDNKKKKRRSQCRFSAPEPRVGTEIGVALAFNLEWGQGEIMEEKIKSKDQTGFFRKGEFKKKSSIRIEKSSNRRKQHS